MNAVFILARCLIVSAAFFEIGLWAAIYAALLVFVLLPLMFGLIVEMICMWCYKDEWIACNDAIRSKDDDRVSEVNN